MSLFALEMKAFADHLLAVRPERGRTNIYDRMTEALKVIETSAGPNDVDRTRTFEYLRDSFEQRCAYTDAFEPHRLNGFHDLQWFIEKAEEIGNFEE